VTMYIKEKDKKNELFELDDKFKRRKKINIEKRSLENMFYSY